MKPSVFESFDETVLLAYVEDELDPEQVTRLRAALFGHDGVLEHLDRLRDDRRELRALPEPDVPRNLLEQLEPLLARPMLVEARPGAYRRRHQRGRRRMIGRLAAAAAVVIVAGAAVLLTLAGLPGTTGGSGDGVDETSLMAAAAGAREATETVADHAARVTPETAADARPANGGVVHHHLPHRSPDLEQLLASASASSERPSGGRRITGSTPLPLPFALIVVADEPGVEPKLVSGLAAMDGSVTVVRNFSFEEARRIEARLADTRRRRSDEPRPPLAAGVDQPSRPAVDPDDELIRRVLERIDRNARSRSDDRPASSRRLLGRAALAATPRHQLIFSGQGASHTATVSAARLAELLRRLHGLPDVRTELCWLPRTVTDPSELSWTEPPELVPSRRRALSDRARIVEHIDRLLADDPEAMVLLPIRLSAP